ncbi:HTH_48 domain-containing protein [Trichonephila clavipes]|nr:HTH_48 domain-containing protein [Trichonephila clavipes]
MFKTIDQPADCEIRSVIRFLTAKNVSAAEIHRQISDVYGPNAMSSSKVQRIVTGDETWVSHITPESKRQSMEWRHTNSPVRAKAKRTISARKVMATVFLDRHGVLSFGWEQIDHSPYSPDLAPSDFHLLRYLKEFLGGKRFDTADEVKEEVQDWLSSQAADVYDLGIQKLVERYDKCLNKYGNYLKTLRNHSTVGLKHIESVDAESHPIANALRTKCQLLLIT